jgi:hypothetical protein
MFLQKTSNFKHYSLTKRIEFRVKAAQNKKSEKFGDELFGFFAFLS